MQTREQIEAQIRAQNPDTTLDGETRLGAGHPEYEALVARWVDARWEQEQAEAAIASRKTWPTVTAFWSEFTDAEKYGIETSQDPTTIVMRADLKLWLSDVWSDDPRIVLGMAQLVAVGILTAERRFSILDPQS
jgi:hypothetical protein